VVEQGFLVHDQKLIEAEPSAGDLDRGADAIDALGNFVDVGA
jgi:hypothetical protein